MAAIPILIDYSTKLCAEQLQPVFDVAYGALDEASTPALARTALDVYSTSEVYSQAQADITFVKPADLGTYLDETAGDARYVNLDGDTMNGPLAVPAGASGAQAQQASEIAALYVPLGGGTMTGQLEVPGSATGLQAPAAQDVVHKAGDTMTGHLEVPAGAAGAQAQQASEIAALIAGVTNTATLDATGLWKDEKTGLMVQWGAATTGLTTFPTAFPTACFAVFCNPIVAEAVGINYVSRAYGITATTFTSKSTQLTEADNTLSDAPTASVSWVAIGH